MKREIVGIENGVIKEKNKDVLNGFYFRLYKSEIVGVIFDSVSEKKSFLQLFRGKLKMESGRLYRNGKKIDIESITTFEKQISIIEKESKLIDTLTVEENVYLFRDKHRVLFGNQYRKCMEEAMQEFDIYIRMNIRIRNLTTLERVQLELLKAYVEEKEIIILSDLTGILNQNDLDEIFRFVKRLQEKDISFIIIESLEDIVFDWTQKLYIIKHGKTLAVMEPKRVNRQQLYQVLLGEHKVISHKSMVPLQEKQLEENTNALELKHVYTNYLKDFSFSLEAGEILKIFFLDDKSCEAIVDVLKGQGRILNGEIHIGNQKQSIKSVLQAMKKGICFIEELPSESMLFDNMTVKDNLSIALSRKNPQMWARRKFSRSVEMLADEYFKEKIGDRKLKKLNPEKLLRITFLKWLLYNPKVIVFIRPFTEVDIHLREITIEVMKEMQAKGIAIIILTARFSELDKLDGDTLFIKNGECIDENAVYQILYGEG